MPCAEPRDELKLYIENSLGNIDNSLAWWEVSGYRNIILLQLIQPCRIMPFSIPFYRSLQGTRVTLLFKT